MNIEGMTKKHPGDNAAPGAMEKPTDINGQLLCLGAGQEHAEIERVKKTRLAIQRLFSNELALHDGDLPRRAAEADEPKLGKPLRNSDVPSHPKLLNWIR
jgi:hypothetical protein